VLLLSAGNFYILVACMSLPRDGGTQQVVDTVENACSAEWCPVQGFTHLLACSTYNLEEDAATQDDDAAAAPQTRHGTVNLYSLSCESLSDAGSACSLKSVASWQPGGGVLDAKWAAAAVNGKAALACGLSTGKLVACALQADSTLLQLASSAEAPTTVSAPEESENDSAATSEDSDSSSDDESSSQQRLCLSLDWSAQQQIIVSESSGTLALWRLAADSTELTLERRWRAHTQRGSSSPAEVWTAFFNKHSPNIVISGADDSLMKGWDLRAGTATAVFTSRQHDMGVTAGEWHPSCEHTFASGSYDESVRIWDVRAVGRGPSKTVAVGGGVWRVRWHPTWHQLHSDSTSNSSSSSSDGVILAACMHGGAKVIRTAQQSCSSSSEDAVLTQYTDEHTSMVYGADWCRSADSLNSDQPAVGTCSFYDHKLCLWRAPIA
jgi:diphthine methyl ester acylhydrolase